MKHKTNPKARRQTRGLIYEPKLDWDKVNYIRANFKEYDPIYGCKGMGKKFGVSANTISKVVNGDVWKPRYWLGDVSPPLTNKRFWRNQFEIHQENERLKEQVKAIRSGLDDHEVLKALQ